jgi:hypothetical protein
MNGKLGISVAVVLIELMAVMAVVPIHTNAYPSDIGTLTTFANGNGVQDFIFPEKGEDWSLTLRLPANSTVLNSTFKVTGSFLGGTNHVDQRNDTGTGWGGETNNQPDYNNTTSVDGGTGVQLALGQLGPRSEEHTSELQSRTSIL